MSNLSTKTDVTQFGPKSYLRYLSRLVIKARVGCIATLSLLCPITAAWADVELLHTYGNSLGQEVTNVIAVQASKLLPLLPPEYNLVPASSVGFGAPDQGIVVIANFRGIDPTVDHREPLKQNQVAIDVAILVFEPSDAVQVGETSRELFICMHLLSIRMMPGTRRAYVALTSQWSL